jgi:EAL domain-containing protein (putative c-di-GMP-specific phosphodiesterase class I)
MTKPFSLDTHTVYVSTSIGIAAYPFDTDNADSLVGCADQAMYAAKEQGRNGFSFFTPAMQQQAQTRLLLANDLRDALAKGQLQVHYQPIVDIASGAIVKAEALLRWQHPQRGMVAPDQFISIAEENGLIHDIGDWVFRQAVETARRWNADGRLIRQISVNLSPRQFIKGDFYVSWLAYLEQSGVSPEHIVFEITEGLLLDDRPDILQIINRLGDVGIQVALDDFGTGYSAMAYLKKFPIDYLKIDRSFVRDLESDPNDRAIAEAIVVMAHKLGLKTIAEGVETVGQRKLLAAVGCEFVQGYLYAKPMPAAEFLTFTLETARFS